VLVHRRWTARAVRTLAVRTLVDARKPWPRYEVIGGELLVAPAPGLSHQVIVGALLILVNA
jgi:hypothetical protein